MAQRPDERLEGGAIDAALEGTIPYQEDYLRTFYRQCCHHYVIEGARQTWSRHAFIPRQRAYGTLIRRHGGDHVYRNVTEYKQTFDEAEARAKDFARQYLIGEIE